MQQNAFTTIDQHSHLNFISLFPSPSPSPSPSLAPSSLSSLPAPAVPGSNHMTSHAFYWGKAHEVLFPGWPGSSTGMYVLAVFFIFFLAILVECLAHTRLIKPGSNRVAACFFRTGFRAVRAGLAYMVILAIMSFNGGIFLAAIVGHAVGYLIFGSGLFYKNDEIPSFDVGVGPSKT